MFLTVSRRYAADGAGEAFEQHAGIHQRETLATRLGLASTRRAGPDRATDRRATVMSPSIASWA
jgi:hypothetical protein